MKQYTYIRIDSMWGKDASRGFFNFPCFITYARTLIEADREFDKTFGVKVARMIHITVKWIDVSHVNTATH